MCLVVRLFWISQTQTKKKQEYWCTSIISEVDIDDHVIVFQTCKGDYNESNQGIHMSQGLIQQDQTYHFYKCKSKCTNGQVQLVFLIKIRIPMAFCNIFLKITRKCPQVGAISIPKEIYNQNIICCKLCKWQSYSFYSRSIFILNPNPNIYVSYMLFWIWMQFL